MKLDVNCSILLTDLPLGERPAAARRLGFTGVEFWWPFPRPVPPEKEVDAFVEAVEAAGTSLVSLNLYAGDMAGGDRGLISWPGRSAEFEDNLDVVLGIGERLGCRRFNALYGNRIEDVSAELQDELGAERLAHAAREAARIGATVVVEPLSGIPAYPLRTAADALSVIDRAAEPNLALLADLYHLSVNGDDVAAVISAHAGRIGHVQIADAPGRGRPGTGALPLLRHLDSLRDNGYDGWVGLEYEPGADPAGTFSWVPRQMMSEVDR